MRKLADIYKSPTGFDSLQNYIGEIPEDNLLVVMGRNRDSNILTQSNWDCALEMLDGESEDVQIIRFDHWACGWIEYFCVVEGSKYQEVAEKIEDSLADYPILNEDHFSEAENEEANFIWEHFYNIKERIEYIREHRNQFDFYDMTGLISCVRGKYFAGYANELIGY